MDLNIIQLKGRVGGSDAQLQERVNPNNNSKFLSLSFSMAVNEKPYTTASGKTIEKTVWMNIVGTYNADKTGNFSNVPYMLRDALVSGEPVHIKGSLQSREITTQAGEQRTIFETVCSNIGDFIMLRDLPKQMQAQPTQQVIQAQAPVKPVQAQTVQAQPIQAQPADVSHLNEDGAVKF